MKDIDFDDGEQAGYQEEQTGFADVIQLGGESSFEFADEENLNESKKHLKIDIDSIDKLVGILKFTTHKLDESMDKVAQNKDLMKILDELSNMKAVDVENYIGKLQNSIDTFDTSRIEKTIDRKFEKAIDRNLMTLEKATKKYEKYAEVFSDEEVANTFEQIDRLEKFRKNFYFKSIILSVAGAAIITSIISFIAASQIIDYKVEQKFESTINPILYFFKGFTKDDVLVAADNGSGVKQLQIKTHKIQVLQAPSGMMYLETKR